MLRRLYDWVLDKAGHRHAVWWLAFFAFADGGLFPFPPHPLLALMCLSQPKKAVRYAAITTLASIAGGLFGYMVGHFLYHTVGAQLLSALGLERRELTGMLSFFCTGSVEDGVYKGFSEPAEVAPGDFVSFRALRPTRVAVCACPDDSLPGWRPAPLLLEVHGA